MSFLSLHSSIQGLTAREGETDLPRVTQNTYDVSVKLEPRAPSSEFASTTYIPITKRKNLKFLHLQ